jgi:hypothetical protein
LYRFAVDRARFAIDAFEGAVEEPVAPAMAVAGVDDFVEIGVQRTGRDLVQQRLPDMRGSGRRE